MRVDPGQEPLRIDKFMLDRVEKISRNRLQNAIRAGAVLVNEGQVKPNYKVRPNDHIVLLIPQHPDSGSGIAGEDIPIHVVYEDEDLMVINKEAGMVVHPGIGNYSGTLVNALKFYLGNSDLPNQRRESTG